MKRARRGRAYHGEVGRETTARAERRAYAEAYHGKSVGKPRRTPIVACEQALAYHGEVGRETTARMIDENRL